MAFFFNVVCHSLITFSGYDMMQAIFKSKYLKIFWKDRLNWGIENLAFIIIMLLIVNSPMWFPISYIPFVSEKEEEVLTKGRNYDVIVEYNLTFFTYLIQPNNSISFFLTEKREIGYGPIMIIIWLRGSICLSNIYFCSALWDNIGIMTKM